MQAVAFTLKGGVMPPFVFMEFGKTDGKIGCNGVIYF